MKDGLSMELLDFPLHNPYGLVDGSQTRGTMVKDLGVLSIEACWMRKVGVVNVRESVDLQP